MLNLLEESKVIGTTRLELENELANLDSRTFYTRTVEPREVKFVYFPNRFASGTIIDPKANFAYDMMLTSSPVTKTYTRSIKPDFIFDNIPLMDELEAHGWFAIIDGERKPFILGERALQDILIISGLLGKGSYIHSPAIVEAALTLLYNDDDKIVNAKNRPVHPKFKFMYRVDENGNQKVLAIRGPAYAGIPQEGILSILDGIMGCGIPDVDGFEITNFLTTVYANLPEIAKDYKDTFQLTEEVMPGVKICTSDSGDAAFQVIPTLNVGNTEKLPLPVVTDTKGRVTRRHFGNVHIHKIVEKANIKLFGEYKKWPEQISKLAQIRVKIPVVDGLELCFAQMNLQAKTPVITKEKEKEIVKGLVALSPRPMDSPYNISKLALKATSLDILSENQKEYLRRFLLLSFYTDYTDTIMAEERRNQNVI